MEPFFYRNPYNRFSPNRFSPFPYGNNFSQNNQFKNNFQEQKNKNPTQEPCYSRNNIPKDNVIVSKEESRNNDSRSPVFEIFGIKLFFDDILIVCLIFFLYNEGVEDQSLFIALILLLLS